MRYLLTCYQSLKREAGQDLAEYALLVALVAVALVLILSALSGGIADIFNALGNVLEDGRTNQVHT